MFKIDESETGRNSQVENDVLETGKAASQRRGSGSEWDKGTRERRTIGSCGTGRGPIFTLGSAAVPATFIVHAVLLSLTQVMYYAESIRSAGDFATSWVRENIHTALSSTNPGLYS